MAICKEDVWAVREGCPKHKAAIEALTASLIIVVAAVVSKVIRDAMIA